MSSKTYLYTLLNLTRDDDSGFFVSVLTDELGIDETLMAARTFYRADGISGGHVYSVGVLSQDEVAWEDYAADPQQPIWIKESRSHYLQTDSDDFFPPVGVAISAHSARYDEDLQRNYTFGGGGRHDPHLQIVCDKSTLGKVLRHVVRTHIREAPVEVVYLSEHYDGRPSEPYNNYSRTKTVEQPYVFEAIPSLLRNGYVALNVGESAGNSGIFVRESKEIQLWEPDGKKIDTLVRYLDELGFVAADVPSGISDVYEYFPYRPVGSLRLDALEERLIASGFFKLK